MPPAELTVGSRLRKAVSLWKIGEPSPSPGSTLVMGTLPGAAQPCARNALLDEPATLRSLISARSVVAKFALNAVGAASTVLRLHPGERLLHLTKPIFS